MFRNSILVILVVLSITSCAKPVVCNPDLRAAIIEESIDKVQILIDKGNSPYRYSSIVY